MKTNFKKLFVFFISLLLAASTIEKANATHAAGADISYCWVGPGINTYRITYTFYRNCGDPINPNPTAEPNTVTVRLISASCGYTNNSFATLPKAPNPNGQEVSLACANVLTYCNGGTEQGYRKWVYTAVVTLPQACSDWQIIVDVNARNNNITTLNNPGGQSLTVVATLNNLYLTNQSPQQHDCAPSFSNPPLAFVCANQLFTYNHSAIDADGDSLVYSVVSPMQSVANVLQPVNFNSPPYSATNPITTSTGFNINPLTGDLSFIPTANGELGVAAFRVDEYRNGILIGSVMRDMQIKVVVCSNTLPTASGVNGNPVYTASVCADNQLCFTINSIDPDPNDTLLMWWNNSLPTATFTVSGTPHPVGQFCWTPTSADVNNNPNTFSVTVRDNACPQNGQQVFTYAITVNPHPVIQTTGNQSVCLGQPATLSASGASTYSWSPSSYLNTTSGPTVISTPPANQTYTVTGTSADGCTGSTTVSVIVNPNPLVVYPANPVICFGHDTLITISGAASYVWTPQTGIVNHNPQYSQVTVSPSSTTIYTVTGYSAEGCSASISFTVTVNPNPVPVVTSNSPICDGSTLTLSATGGTVYSWTGPNSFSSSSSGPSITGAGLSASGTYNVLVTDANSCSASGSVNVTVNPNPVPVLNSNSPVCAGSTLNLTASGGTTYSWTGPNSFSSSTQNPSISNATIGATGIYTVDVGDANGCHTVSTINATVNANPVPVVSSNSPICAGSTLNLSASGGTTYTWSGPNSFSSSTQNPSIGNAAVNATGTYSVIVGDANGCHTTATVSVTVNANPVPVVGSNSPICAGSTLTLSASGGTTYSWTGPNSFSSSTQNPSIGNAPVNATGTYSVNVGDANNCHTIGTVNVTVNANPVPVVSSNSPICAGTTLHLYASGGTTYSWSGPGGYSSSQQNPSRFNAQVSASGTYTVNVGDANGCHSTATVSVTVNANPVPVVNSNSPICAGSMLNLTASGGTTYAWSGPNSFSSSTQNPSIGNATVNATGSYSVNVGDANGCHTTATVSVTVNANPVPVVGSNSPICAGSTLTLSASGGTTYSWTGPDGFSSSISNPAITGAAVTATGTYSVNVGDANNCHTVSTVNATVNANPVPVVGNNSPICDGFNLNLTATGGTTFAWTGPNGFTSGAQNPSIASASLSATGTYTVDVGDANNCHTISTTSATVNPNPTPSITPLGPTEFCAGGSVMLDGGNYSSYQWNTVPAQSTSSITVSQTSTFNLQVWDNNGCTAVSAPITITVDPNPVPVITPDGPIAFCIGGNVRLDAGVWDAYEWSGAGETTSFITVSVTRTVDVTVWDNHGCQGTSAPLTVTVNPLPPAVVTPAGPVLICSGSPATLSANTGTGYTYQWYNNSAPISGAVGSTYLATTTGLYSVRIVDANTCTNLSNSVQVTQGTGPAVTVTASPGIGCLLNTIFVGYGPQDITLTAQAPGAVSYLWSPGGQTTQSITVTQPGNYSVIAYDINGCPSPSPGVLSPPINVIDIRCGHNLNKVVLCHVPEGNFNNPQTLCIGQPAIDPHLRLHRWDCLGPCSLYYPRTNAIDVGDFYVIPSPNPFDNALTLHILTTEYDNPVKVKVMDVTGRLVETYNDVTEQTEIGLNLKAGVYIAVVTQGDNKQVIQIVKTK